MNEPPAVPACPAEPTIAEIADIEAALAQARDLKAWWARVEAGAEPVERFALFPAGPGSEPVWGFFGTAPVQGRNLPVMGNVIDEFFDRPRVPAAQQGQAARWMLEQVEEFALRYWLRSAASALPEPYPELGHGDPAPFFRAFSLCFPADQEFSGSGYAQRLFRRSGGQVGEFPPAERLAIVDLRELSAAYRWINLAVRLFDFNLTLTGAGDEAPSLVIPLDTTVQCVTSADLIENRRDPEPGTLGVFGPGLGLVRSGQPGVIAVAPDLIQPGLRLQTLRVLDTGEVRARGITILPRPTAIVHLSPFAPEPWLAAADAFTLGAARGVTAPVRRVLDRFPLPRPGFDPVLAWTAGLNLVTGGRAARELCISKEQIEKEILVKDSQGARQGFAATRQSWLQVPDWLDPAGVPARVVRGEAA